MLSRERLPANGRTESLGRDGGGKGEEPNYLHCSMRTGLLSSGMERR